MEMFSILAKSKQWHSYPSRAASCYCFPLVDFSDFFQDPYLPTVAWDNISSDVDRSLSKSPFENKDKAQLEEVLRCLD